MGICTYIYICKEREQERVGDRERLHREKGRKSETRRFARSKDHGHNHRRATPNTVHV